MPSGCRDANEQAAKHQSVRREVAHRSRFLAVFPGETFCAWSAILRLTGAGPAGTRFLTAPNLQRLLETAEAKFDVLQKAVVESGRDARFCFLAPAARGGFVPCRKRDIHERPFLFVTQDVAKGDGHNVVAGIRMSLPASGKGQGGRERCARFGRCCGVRDRVADAPVHPAASQV